MIAGDIVTDVEAAGDATPIAKPTATIMRAQVARRPMNTPENFPRISAPCIFDAGSLLAYKHDENQKRHDKYDKAPEICRKTTWFKQQGNMIEARMDDQTRTYDARWQNLLFVSISLGPIKKFLTAGQLGDGTLTTRLTPVTTTSFAGLVRARARFAATALTAGVHTLRRRIQETRGISLLLLR